jgi:hypothetical protein
MASHNKRRNEEKGEIIANQKAKWEKTGQKWKQGRPPQGERKQQ